MMLLLLQIEKLIDIIQTDHSNNRWLRVASAFFDETGQIMHPDDLKAKFSKYFSP